MIKKYISCVVFFSFLSIFSQNKPILYDFAELPQTLLLNPGAKTNYKLHVGVPLLSAFSSEVGSTGVALSDLFLSDRRVFSDKVSNVLGNLTARDYVKLNTQIEILNIGYRINNKTYISAGFYEEIDVISYFPTDVLTLLNEGNAAYLNKSFDFSQLLYKIDVLGVLHAGITRKIDENLTLGARFKIYSSSLNIESTGNTGTFTTVNGSDNIYTHYLDNVDVNLRTSGLVGADDEYIDDPATYLGNSFFGDNMGVGIDIGVTYNLSKQLEFTGSILDVGFINHSKNIKNTFVKGSYVTSGLEFEYDSNNSTNYWQELKDDFDEKIITDDNQDSYVSWRPAKINAALKYSFGEVRSRYCYDDTYKDFYASAVGVHLNTVFRPLSPQVALTGFYQYSFTKKVHTKFTYTVDRFSYYNVGAGLSAQIGMVNFYGMIDNVLEFNDLSSANSISFQLGLNLIFN